VRDTLISVLVLLAFPLLFLAALYAGGILLPLYALVSLSIALALLLRIVIIGPDPLALAADNPPPLPERRYAAFGRSLMLMALLFGLAMLIHGRVLDQLQEMDAALILLPLARQRLEAGVISLILSGAFLLLTIIFGALLVVQLEYWPLADSPGNPPTTPVQRWQRALSRAVRIIAGGSQGTMILDRGKIRYPDGREAGIDACLGPVYIDTREGQAAIVETRGQVSHAQSGRFWLEGNQRLTGFVDLSTQTAQITVEKALTRDGMVIEGFDVTVRYSVGVGSIPDAGPADPDLRSASGQLQFKPARLMRNHWKDTPWSFKEGVQKASEAIVRTTIGSYEMRDIAILTAASRTAIEAALRSAIQQRFDPDERWMYIVRVSIGKITLSEPAYTELIRRWATEMQAISARIRAEADRDTLILKGQGQADAMRVVENAKQETRVTIAQTVNQIANMDPANAARNLRIVLNLIGYMSQDSLRQVQVSEMLEEMARHSRQFNLNVVSDELLNATGAPVPPAASQPAVPPPMPGADS
jgi:regulator of protease activity HflC (stomatin/prohibitin superfamily)